MVKAEKAEKTEIMSTEVQEKPQIKPEAVQTSVGLLTKTGPEVGPGPPQTPPTAQNEPKTDEGFTELQEKLRMDGELFYEKIDTIWTFCKYGKKKQQIDEEIKKVYKESEQKLIKKVSDAYTKSGGSVQALQELLKGLPIPAKFAQKTEKSSTEVQGSMQSIVQNPPKVDVKALQKSDEKLQGTNLNTNSPPSNDSSFPADFGEMFGEAFARAFRKERTPLDNFMDNEV